MKQKKKTKVSIEKLRFLMGILIVMTGGTTMLYFLGSSISTYIQGVGDYILFPVSIILLVTGIGVVSRNMSSFK